MIGRQTLRRGIQRYKVLWSLVLLTYHWRAALSRRMVLLRVMVRRDLASRYRGSLLGVAWAVLTPFLLMVLYTIIFSVFLKIRLSGDNSPSSFALYLLAGLLPWTMFSEVASRCTTVMLGQVNLIKKVVFPLEVIPLTITGAGLVNHLIGLGVFLLAAAVLASPQPTWLLLPVLIIPLSLFSAGVGLILASLGVFLRDLGQVVGLLLTAWMFLTPIMYAESFVPARFLPLIDANPFTWLVHGYRQVVLEGQLPSFSSLLLLYGVASVVAIIGYRWFQHLAPGFADVL